MNVTKGSAPTLSATVDAATNRLGVGTYDANGNQVTGLPAGGYSYDVENRMISPGSVDIIYAYSPSNQRVWKGTYNVDQFFNWTLASQEVYFYGVDGKRLGTYSVAPNPPLGTSIIATELFVYFGQKMVGKSYSPYQPTTFVPFVGNRLGSNGDYYPYGQDKGTPLPNDEVKFATYTRDSATGLDYAMNRYYSNSLGRFTSPDQYANGRGSMSDPQGWNLYSYSGNDPANRNDPSGSDWCEVEDDDPLCSFGFDFGSIPSGGILFSIPGLPGPCWTGPNYSTFVPNPGCAALAASLALAFFAPAPKPLTCAFSGATVQPSGAGFVDGNRATEGYYAPVDFYFTASGGNGIYTWSDTQTVNRTGARLFTSGQTVSAVKTFTESLNNHGDPAKGPIADFFDAPGIAQVDPNYGNVAAANITWNFTLNATVSSGGVTVKCPSVSWSVVLKWPKGVSNPLTSLQP